MDKNYFGKWGIYFGKWGIYFGKWGIYFWECESIFGKLGTKSGFPK